MQVLSLEFVSEKVAQTKHNRGEFPIYFFGERNCGFVSHGAVMPFDDRMGNATLLLVFISRT